ncbi:MAG: hypothetical protein IPM24_01190 [Bryobacterales bacterium]|nr:hypothetical protein [Bryobacterales bacterium]
MPRLLIAFLAVAACWAVPPVIEVDTPRPAPTWAVMQRRLIAVMNRAGEAFVERYTNRDGSLIWKERYEGGMNSSDDAYEAFRGFSLLYVMGGSPELDRLHRRVWDGITRQFTRYGQIYREFDGNWDWMHHGEGYTSFYPMGMADPFDTRFRDRAIRFAAMYTGEDPEARNYDPQRKLMRASMTGSRGPKMEWTTRDWIPTNANLAYYHLPYDDIPGVTSSVGWINDDAFATIVSVMSRRMARGDVPINMTAVPLVANAYLYTGDEKYIRWTRDYIGSWIALTEQNGGITPDNVGLSGRIGEYMDGNWWGGYYGWKWPRGGMDVVRAALTAAKAAYLLTGESSWLDLPRSQMRVLQRNTRSEKGVPHVAMRYDQRGWHHYQPEPAFPWVQLWYMSGSEDDRREIARLADVRGAQAGDDPDLGWMLFLDGKNPGYPEQTLRRDLANVERKLRRILNEHGDPETWVDSHWSSLDPVPCEALVRLTLGGLPVDLRGGMLHARLRYFDADAESPGLPEDVAALVTGIEPDSVTVELVNTSLFEHRSLYVQGGAYGEHLIASVETGGRTTAVNEPLMRVGLAPGAGAVLKIRLKRFAARPAYSFPWRRS